MNRTLEVRCCCSPGKLLGYLKCDDSLGEKLFPLQVTNFRPLPLKDGAIPYDSVEYQQENVRLEVAKLSFSGGKVLVCIKSNDVPLSKLKKIKGFIPVGSLA